MKKLLLVLFFLIFSNSTFADPKMELGLEVYNNKAQCGVCHSLKSNGSVGEIGPNLDQINAQVSRIIYVVTNGVGVMPPLEGILTSEEIEAVAYYVFNTVNE